MMQLKNQLINLLGFGFGILLWGLKVWLCGGNLIEMFEFVDNY